MRKLLIIASLFTILLSSCGGVESYLKNKDANFRLTKANEYYEKKSWYKANALYASLIPVVRGTKNYEELVYRYAYSFYNMKDYLSSSYQFRTFVDNFPSSKRAEECEYMYAMSLYSDAPKPSLDQSSTIKAMAALHTFTSLYKNSKYTSDANKYLDICRAKLELKEANAAKLYFDMEQFQSAKVAYKAALDEYPESQNADYYHYMIVRANYRYALRSRLEKQEERFAEVVSTYNTLKELYPQSTYLKNAESINVAATSQINKLRKNNEHN
ncbi:hypothetical protein DBR32_05745 [Taibaiella sp. KBW10]|uniref:outer membrane protein assembly factor BamD n=1 Tax=Taibaiella sp. KBW10 TaxID=2153357 RepID=UPI000F594A0C|nr:outer membrane protein assembly factor BamD [Taibaiella sp. KBW10]RQO31463.1 hypothetical protein DBR32_05745 [Taibaiella sp. KBW10]